MTDFNMTDFNSSIQNMEEDISNNIEERDPDNVFKCSGCDTLIHVDPYLIYSNAEWETYDKKQLDVMRYWHSKYSYSKEVSPGHWLTFCRKVCEIKYDRRNEEGWETPANKKHL